ncbi:hypothetical protein RHO15_09655 [Utexia brackfieldae]|uniref:hypothetical protein n=1 Tax=Utexia brackfieldae TaxID=3074108 RepID=UPI00370D5009
MIDKLKSLMPLSLVTLGLVFAVYFGYEQYQHKKHAQQQINELSSEIEHLYKSINDTNELVAQQEREKANLENQSIELQELLQNALKDDTCASSVIPSDVSNKLREHSNKIRLSENTE